MMRIPRTLLATAALCVSLALALAPGGSGLALHSKRKPRITVKPSNVMVDHTTHLVGSGFAPNSSIEITECERTSWLAPEEACDATLLTVKTGARGNFSANLKATICPRKEVRSPPTEETCYVGEVHPFGVDQVELLGAAKLIVTYP